MNKREFIVQDLLSKIYQNIYTEGKLPDQRSLATMYSVSRYTVQQAVKLLEEMGMVKLVQGSGIYIREEWVKNPLIFNSLTRTPYDRIQSRMISLKKQSATLEEQKIFELGSTDEVWIFERTRIVNYKIEQIEVSKMPVKLFPDLSQVIVEHSIQKYVESKGYRISHFITSYKPTVVNNEQSKLFVCKRGTPAMRIINRALLEDGRVYEQSEIIAIDYEVTYIRPFDRGIHQSRID